MKKIAFFDIDGTLTSEIDGSIPQSAITAIRKARANGNLMFLNTGRCIQNVEPRFQEVGFDGFVCGCGTDIYCGGKNLLHVTQSHEITMELLKAARDTNVDIVFESSTAVAYDPVRPVIHPDAVAQYDAFRGGTFREFVPHGYSKATGIQFVLDHYNLSKEDAYAFGDSNNDLPMLSYLPNSVAMGNAYPASLFDRVSFVTKKASEDGIAFALEHFSFL